MPRLYETARSVELLAAPSFTLVEVTVRIYKFVLGYMRELTPW